MKDQAERYQKWWQKIRQYPVMIVAIIIAAVLVVTIVLGYWMNWNSIGLGGKTLWDWLQLLIIPVVLVIGGYIFSLTTSRNDQKRTQQRDQIERDIALDNQREAVLQSYIDKMSEFLLEKHLRESKDEDEVRTIARVRTLIVLPRLDTMRKGSVLQFLYESNLIDKDKGIFDLNGANLEGTDLRAINLAEANLEGVNLSGADMRFANLKEANLLTANLRQANLEGAYLSGANLSGTLLNEADLSEANLRQTNLKGAYLSGANLSGANLSGALLTEALLTEADLSKADLYGADLSGANLSGADLSYAYLDQANLSGTLLGGANLSNAIVTSEQLDAARSLKDTIVPDGSKHP